MSKFVTPHFKWSEFTDSDKALELSIENVPDEYAKANIVQLARILERVRLAFGKPIVINSGYRCKSLNDILPGASKDSYHLDGRAVDISVIGFSDEDVAMLLHLLDVECPVEMYIKNRSYVHVAY